MKAVVGNLATSVKRLAGKNDRQAELERGQVIERAKVLGLIKEGQGVDDILGLTLKDVMERRLQTIVHKKGLSLTVRQARQMITHEHIIVDGRKITSPSYIVPVHEESMIQYSHDSPFTNTSHPERAKYDEKSNKGQPEKPAAQAPEQKLETKAEAKQ